MTEVIKVDVYNADISTVFPDYTDYRPHLYQPCIVKMGASEWFVSVCMGFEEKIGTTYPIWTMGYTNVQTTVTAAECVPLTSKTAPLIGTHTEYKDFVKQQYDKNI